MEMRIGVDVGVDRGSHEACCEDYGFKAGGGFFEMRRFGAISSGQSAERTAKHAKKSAT